MSYHVVSRTSAVGTVDQPALDRLRAALDLTRMGRLSDAEDEEFGYRDETVDGSDVMINLWRLGEGQWSYQIRYLDQPPPDDYIERHRAAFREAFAQAGLVVVEDVRR